MSRTRSYDSAEFLETDEAVTAYLSAAAKEGDGAQFRHALGVVARAGGILTIACESLYGALSDDGKPSLDTTLRMLRALNVCLTAEAAGG